MIISSTSPYLLVCQRRAQTWSGVVPENHDGGCCFGGGCTGPECIVLHHFPPCVLKNSDACPRLSRKKVPLIPSCLAKR